MRTATNIRSALVEGATENATTVQALIDNLVERGLDPTVRRLFIIDGAKALSKAIRRTFGRDAAIQRCQIHKARNILERLPKSMHASVRRVLRQAWEMDDAEKAETLIRNPPASRKGLERLSASILEGHRRDAHCHEARTPSRTAPLARLHEHHRECHGHGAPGLPQRQILALALDGPAMGRRRHAGSNQGLPSIEGIQASASSSRRSWEAPPDKKLNPRRTCSPS